jgi:D-alanyl-D-alanine carboxypeptidase
MPPARRLLPIVTTATVCLLAPLLAGCARGSAVALVPSSGPPALSVPTEGTTPESTTTSVPSSPSTTRVRTTTTRPASTTVATTIAPTTTWPVPTEVVIPPPGQTTTEPSYAPTTSIAVADPARAGDPFAAFDQSLSSALFDRGALGVSVAVARNGRLVHTQAFGADNPYTGRPAEVASRYRIASVSKTLLAMAILELVEERRLSLDQPVLTGLAKDLDVTFGDPAMASITLRQLLSHTSGLPEYQRTFFGGGAAHCREAAARGLSRGLAGAPGTLYQYSNLNYCVLGVLVEELTGRSYEAVVDDLVLEPLGIDDMRTAGTYDAREGDVVHPTSPGRRFMEALGAAGNWIGTATDLVRLVDSLDARKPGHHPLSTGVVTQMLQRAPVAYPHDDSWYGLGLIVWDHGQSFGHTGTIENARSMVFHRADGVTWAVLVNGGGPSNTANLRKYMDEALATVASWPS